MEAEGREQTNRACKGRDVKGLASVACVVPIVYFVELSYADGWKSNPGESRQRGRPRAEGGQSEWGKTERSWRNARGRQRQREVLSSVALWFPIICRFELLHSRGREGGDVRDAL